MRGFLIMTAGILSRDKNTIPVMGAVSSLTDLVPRSLQYDDTTRGLTVHIVGDDSPALPTGINGAPATIGTTAVEMTFTGTTKVIAIKSASTNTGLIWFGPAGVTNTGANAYGELTADSAVEIELNDASSPIYCISVTATQKVYKAALT